MDIKPLNIGRQSRLEGKLETLSPKAFRIRTKLSPRCRRGEIENIIPNLASQEIFHSNGNDEESKFIELLDALKVLDEKC